MAQSIKNLTSASITVLNQAVLLKNINDNADVLVALSEALFSVGILPYYLHMLDKVEGGARFDLERKMLKTCISKLPNGCRATWFLHLYARNQDRLPK